MVKLYLVRVMVLLCALTRFIIYVVVVVEFGGEQLTMHHQVSGSIQAPITGHTKCHFRHRDNEMWMVPCDRNNVSCS